MLAGKMTDQLEGILDLFITDFNIELFSNHVCNVHPFLLIGTLGSPGVSIEPLSS